ncbi:unnamed protein product, partial [Brenthis ino]
MKGIIVLAVVPLVFDQFYQKYDFRRIFSMDSKNVAARNIEEVQLLRRKEEIISNHKFILPEFENVGQKRFRITYNRAKNKTSNMNDIIEDDK